MTTHTNQTGRYGNVCIYAVVGIFACFSANYHSVISASGQFAKDILQRFLSFVFCLQLNFIFVAATLDQVQLGL